MSEYKEYKKKGILLMRPYEPGESLKGIFVSGVDEDEISYLIDGIIPKEQTGMIAMNTNNPEDKWYIGFYFFLDNYEEVV